MNKQNKKEIEKMIEEKIKSYLNPKIDITEIDKKLDKDFNIENPHQNEKLYKINNDFCILVNDICKTIAFYVYKDDKYYNIKSYNDTEKIKEFLESNYKVKELPEKYIEELHWTFSKYKINDNLYIIKSPYDAFYIYNANNSFNKKIIELSNLDVKEIDKFLDTFYYRFGMSNMKVEFTKENFAEYKKHKENVLSKKEHMKEYKKEVEKEKEENQWEHVKQYNIDDTLILALDVKNKSMWYYEWIGDICTSSCDFDDFVKVFDKHLQKHSKVKNEQKDLQKKLKKKKKIDFTNIRKRKEKIK